MSEHLDLTDSLFQHSERWIKDHQNKNAASLFDWNTASIEEYKNIPLDTLLNNDYFLGLEGVLYDGVYADLVDLWDEKAKRDVNLAVFLEGIGAGKCFASNSLVFTPNGLKRIKSFKKDRSSGFSPLKTKVLDFNNQTVDTSQFYITEKPLKSITIKTRAGYEITGAYNSKLKVLRAGQLVWIKFKDLVEDDYVPILINQNTFAIKEKNLSGKSLGPQVINPNIAYLLGAILGDGCISKNHPTITISAHEKDSSILYKCKDIVINNLYYEPRINPIYNKPHLLKLSINNKRIITWIKNTVGLEGNSRIKIIPSCILEGTKETQIQFIRGYFDTDGSVRKRNGTIELTSVSRDNIKTLQIILNNFGILSSTAKRATAFKIKGKLVFEGVAWRIKITGHFAKLFFKSIGFDLIRKQEGEAYLPSFYSQSSLGSIPVTKEWIDYYLLKYKTKHNKTELSRLNRLRLSKLKLGRQFAKCLFELPNYYSDNIYYLPIKSKSNNVANILYDFEVPKEHSFQSNGFLVHNSFKASIILWLLWYELSMSENPQRKYGLASDSIMAIMLMSRSATQSRRVVYNYTWDRFQTGFNRDYFPADPKYTSEIRINRNRTCVYAGTSSALSALGYNLYSAVIDEANFLEVTEDSSKADGETYDAGEDMYNAIMNRMTSRFMIHGKIPGIIVCISSPRFPDSFMERKIKEIKAIGEIESKAFWRQRSLWEAKGPKYFNMDEYFTIDTETLEIIEEVRKQTK